MSAVAFSGLVAVAFDSLGRGDGAWAALVGVIAFAVVGANATAMVWRARFPVVICAATAAAAVVVPVDALAPLIALSWVIATRRARTAVLCGLATAAAVGVSLARDAAREGEAVVFAVTSSTTDERSYLLPAGYVALGVTFLVVAVAAGMVRRTLTYERSVAQVASRRADELRTQADELRTELSRQDERELIAREMHDTVAHHLSLVSLHASALEVTAPDPEVGEAARSMRSSARRALDEMRALIASLRTQGETFDGPVPTLADLARLLDEARTAGLDVAPTFFVSDAVQAPPALTRAVYRIVQEALTNVIKHAPGARADVSLTAAPGAGVDLVVRNRLRAAPADATGARAGLAGMRERAEALGGRFDAGIEREDFVVRVHLPWERPSA
ncbi:sensor histidine kinase [Cellulomonas composti]|uniref:histidine kinase n=1 Tax=Cellulomonas composti TaxID=266130 RepID=A0A511JAT9_9CELL|nr:histidine kinase [Cellulomonas composti]GEL94823.1 two-component sensor histidine kinase [Cellulomonas composti]